MALRFFIKKFPKNKNICITVPEINNEEISIQNTSEENVKNETLEVKKNKKQKNQETMNFNDKIKQVEETLVSMEPEVKVVKKDKGLIERTESSKIILTEDNRQLLND